MSVNSGFSPMLCIPYALYPTLEVCTVDSFYYWIKSAFPDLFVYHTDLKESHRPSMLPQELSI
jgi:hypothetical protein